MMDELIVGRRVSRLLESLREDEPVIALHGPRSVGKSTLLRAFAQRHDVDVIDLDDPVTLDAVVASPGAAVDGRTPVCIDEYQHAPELLDALKARLNREGARPGVAVLTGSTRQDALPRTAQALTGRLHAMTIWPLSQGEQDGMCEDLVESLSHDPIAAVAAHSTSTTSRADYVGRITAGGFPLAIHRSEIARSRWFDDYVRTSVERDAKELARIRQRQVLIDLLSRLAAQTAQVLNVSRVAAALGAERVTIEEYVRLLEDLFLVWRLPAWGKTLRARATTRSKIHLVDSGLAARLLRLTPAKLTKFDPTASTEFGYLVETFVVGELRKQVSWLNELTTFGHWRTSDGDEVDFIVEFDDGRVLAFEVKAAERVNTRDFKGIRKLREALGKRLIAGIVFTTGRYSYSIEDRLHVLPIDRIWQPTGLNDR